MYLPDFFGGQDAVLAIVLLKEEIAEVSIREVRFVDIGFHRRLKGIVFVRRACCEYTSAVKCQGGGQRP